MSFCLVVQQCKHTFKKVKYMYKTRRYFSRMRTTRSPTLPCLSRQPPDVSREGGPQVNKFEQVSNFGHQMLARDPAQ